MVASTELYDALEVSPDASAEQIKRAYRKLAMRYHPDKNAGDGAAKERFQAISEAYTLLADPEKRAFYDETGELDEADISPEDFVSQFQEMMEELMDGQSVLDMVAGMSAAEIAAMPPFPFPRELFPQGTFPKEMRFSSEGLDSLPPSMMRAAAAGMATPEMLFGCMDSGDSRGRDSGASSSRGGEQTPGGGSAGRAPKVKARKGGGARSSGARGRRADEEEAREVGLTRDHYGITA